MRRCWLLVVIILVGMPLQAQQKEEASYFFHDRTLTNGQRAMPFSFLRAADIAWVTTLWRNIDLHESFNQFFYFPLDNDDRYDKKSLAYIIWDAVREDRIPIFEDDELKIPLDNLRFVEQYTKPDTIRLEIGYDDDDNEEYQTVVRPHEFDGAEIFAYSLRDACFISKHVTRQESRRIALAPLKDMYRRFGDNEEGIYLGQLPLFWMPMVNPAVRNLLASYDAHAFDNTTVNQPSWDYIFVSQYYNPYIIRESNVKERSILLYLTGEDALLQAAIIEERVLEIEVDMWDY